MEYVVISYPESEKLLDKEGFRQNCKLINGKRGIEEYGERAYLVNADWLNVDDDDDDWTSPIDEATDKELEDLYLL